MLKAIFLLLGMWGQTSFASPRELVIAGEAQSWHRDCVPSGCTLPVASGAKKEFRLKLNESLAPGSVATAKTTLELGPLVVELSYFWVSEKSRPGLQKGYISIQQKLFRREGRKLLAEAGQYRADHNDAVIPVGFIASPIAGGRQLGVTFTRLEQ